MMLERTLRTVGKVGETMKKTVYYVLIDQTPVEETDLLKWAKWLETADRRVALTELPGCTVSTVFLGLDHNWFDGRPILFESMKLLGRQHAGIRSAAVLDMA